MHDHVSLETPRSVRRVLGATGVVIGLLLPVAMFMSRKGETDPATRAWGCALGLALGALVASLYFKVARIRIDADALTLTLTKRWCIEYLRRDIPLSAINGLAVIADPGRGEVYEIRYAIRLRERRVTFASTEFNGPHMIFEALSRATGVPVTYR